MRELDWRPKMDLSSGLRQTIGYFDGLLTRPARELEAV
jgi:UDP-glucuronate decarboxylase